MRRSCSWNAVFIYSYFREAVMTGTRNGPTGASSYEQIGKRIQRLVSAPNVQKIQWVTVARRDDEPEDSWNVVLRE
ncbi:ATP-dependent hsl protease ATP-binding subunit hslU, partial [Pseudomonas savastanoi pv. glycinea]